jgi:hypothetical protein
MKLFFLVYLSNREPRKNKGTPSPEQIQGEIFYLAFFQLENNYWSYKIRPKIVNKKIQWTCNHQSHTAKMINTLAHHFN